MSRTNSDLNKIIQYTPIDQPIRLRHRHNLVCIGFAFTGLGLYYANLDEPTAENILTDYLGVLFANFASIYFAGREYFKDKLERDIPPELSTILVRPSHRTSLIVSGSLLAALPYAAMAWDSAAIRSFKSNAVNKSLTALLAGLTWVVNGFMNNIPVRVILEDTKMCGLLFWFLLLPYIGMKCLIERYYKPREGNYFLLTENLMERKLDHRARIIDQIDTVLQYIPRLDDNQLRSLYRTIQGKNTPEAKADADYFSEIVAEVGQLTTAPELSMNASLPPLLEDEAKGSLICATPRVKCARVLDHSYFNKILLILGALIAGIILLADGFYVKDNSENLADKMGFSREGQEIFGWLMLYLAMSFAWVLAKDFCTGTLQYGADLISNSIYPKKTKNLSTRFYPKARLGLNVLSGYLGYFSSAAGIKLYSQKISDSVLIGVTNVGIKLFNTRALLGLVDDSLQIYGDHCGAEPAQAAIKITSFFQLLKRRVSMMQDEEADNQPIYNI